jgi:glucan phosphorylase
MDKEGLADSLAGWLNNIIGKDQAHASQRDWYNALALTVRERLMARWITPRRDTGRPMPNGSTTCLSSFCSAAA